MNQWVFPGALALAALVCADPAGAAPTPAQLCQAAKNKAAGKYSQCRLKAYAKTVSTPCDRNEPISRRAMSCREGTRASARVPRPAVMAVD